MERKKAGISAMGLRGQELGLGSLRLILPFSDSPVFLINTAFTCHTPLLYFPTDFSCHSQKQFFL